ncbi:MAG TPA: 4'-phosphopantetheinyl transferase superfamily protein, partial [Steroidobacteraceae bacterium]|nr:4'-phosphopantetheinyl transferase superfamily protein [Steroidobacteraceae bacterium]
ALGPVGVDLEPAGAGDFDGVADVALTPRERLALRRLPSEQRSSAALTWWVRKEAVLKATGDGCSWHRPTSKSAVPPKSPG